MNILYKTFEIELYQFIFTVTIYFNGDDNYSLFIEELDCYTNPFCRKLQLDNQINISSLKALTRKKLDKFIDNIKLFLQSYCKTKETLLYEISYEQAMYEGLVRTEKRYCDCCDFLITNFVNK